MPEPSILVLGAYGLAGNAIVHDLIDQTTCSVVAAGRNAQKLAKLASALPSRRIETAVLDVEDHGALRQVCERASIVVNAVGPYAQSGAAIARVVVDSGKHYVDCASEQVHYRRLQELDTQARERGVLMVTGAGAIPGWSTLLIGDTLRRFPEAQSVNSYWAHLRLPDSDSGLASVMGGILEITHRPAALVNGEERPVPVGSSVQDVSLPQPFGTRTVVEVPNIDTYTIPKRYPVRDLHTWFYFGDLPIWLFGILRAIDPGRRPLIYRFIERIVRRMNARDTARAIAAGVGPEGLLLVVAQAGAHEKRASIVFRDGAQATARLPVLTAREIALGRVTRTGLCTPLDLFDPTDALGRLGDTILSLRLATDSL